ncbi:MAG: DNA primase DnaG [Promethearchaeati archaeon]
MGRIEVENESKDGISKGTIRIPSSLTRKETALLAATVETVSRVGPCEAKIKLIEISDVRETKRKKIIERAAELLKEWDQSSLDASEIEEQIDTDIKLGEIVTWGPENLPAGPDIDEREDLIIVEGRADVLNLLRIGIKNTVAVQGTSVPKSIIDLTKEKSPVTFFGDGDRGGTLILKELLQVADIDYVARAPEGYEVEELTRKQMIKSLQNKRAVKEGGVEEFVEEIPSEEDEKEDYSEKEKILSRFLKKLKVKNKDLIIDKVRNIGIGQAIALDDDLEQLFEISVGNLYEKLDKYKECSYLIMDGILTSRLLSLLLKLNLKFVACKNREEDLKIPDKITVFYF